MSIDTVSLIKVFSAYVCSFKLYCLFNTMKDAKIANNIVERLTKWIDREKAVANSTVVRSRRYHTFVISYRIYYAASPFRS